MSGEAGAQDRCRLSHVCIWGGFNGDHLIDSGAAVGALPASRGGDLLNAVAAGNKVLAGD